MNIYTLNKVNVSNFILTFVKSFSKIRQSLFIIHTKIIIEDS